MHWYRLCVQAEALAVIREGWLSGRFQVYVSEFLLTEVEHTLTKPYFPYFAERLGQERIHRFLTLLKRTAVLQPIIDPVWGASTPKTIGF